MHISFRNLHVTLSKKKSSTILPKACLCVTFLTWFSFFLLCRYGYLTNTKVKFILVTNEIDVKDADMRNVRFLSIRFSYSICHQYFLYSLSLYLSMNSIVIPQFTRQINSIVGLELVYNKVTQRNKLKLKFSSLVLSSYFLATS